MSNFTSLPIIDSCSPSSATQAIVCLLPLSGWGSGQVSMGYRDLGLGRVRLTELDWQDNENGNDATMQPTNKPRGYVINNRRSSFRGSKPHGTAEKPPRATAGGGFLLVRRDAGGPLHGFGGLEGSSLLSIGTSPALVGANTLRSVSTSTSTARESQDTRSVLSSARGSA